MSSSLEQLKATGTTVVSDSGNFIAIAKYKPQDATTDPSLILAACKRPEYHCLLDSVVKYAKEQASTQLDPPLDPHQLIVAKSIIPGYSTGRSS